MEDQFEIGAQVTVKDITSPFYSWTGRVREEIEMDGDYVNVPPTYRVDLDENGIGLSLTFEGSQLGKV